MKTRGRKTLTILLALAAMTLPAWPARAFDIDLAPDPSNEEYMRIEKPSSARNFVDHVAIYLRFVPKRGNRVFPAFINTQNYLTCPDSDMRWTLGDVKQVSNERRRGIKVLGFFFDTPTCGRPTFHMKAVVAGS